MKSQTKAYLSLAFISIVWGTTYLAIRVGVMHYPAFLFAALRQLFAGVLIMSIGLVRNRTLDLNLRHIGHHALVGFLMIAVGNGIVTWAEQFVPSGITALLCGLMPVVAVLLNLVIFKKERLNGLILLGMMLGVAGVALISRKNMDVAAGSRFYWGIAGVMAAITGWAMGSILSKHGSPGHNPIFNTGIQLVSGGVCLLIASLLFDDLHHIEWWQAEAITSLVYLIVFGSVLAFSAYTYALKVLPVGLVTSYAYINPLVAVLLGYFMLKEPLNLWTVLAFMAIISGVYMVNLGYRAQHQPQDQTPREALAVVK